MIPRSMSPAWACGEQDGGGRVSGVLCAEVQAAWGWIKSPPPFASGRSSVTGWHYDDIMIDVSHNGSAVGKK